MGRWFRATPFWSFVAACATVAGTVMFCILLDMGIHGFLYQLGAFSERVSEVKVHWEIVLLGVSTSALALVFLLVGMRSTLVTEFEDKLDSSGRCFTFNAFVHPSFMFAATVIGYGTVIVWIILLCCAVTVAVLYMLFIGVMYTFCATVDNRCFDLSVLLPAIVKYVSNNKIDLTFCQGQERGDLSSRE